MTPAHVVGRAGADLHFFSDDNTIGYELPQEVKSTPDGGFTVTLHLSAEGTLKTPSRLLGVLANEDGWHSDHSVRGLHIDVPL